MCSDVNGKNALLCSISLSESKLAVQILGNKMFFQCLGFNDAESSENGLKFNNDLFIMGK